MTNEKEFERFDAAVCKMLTVSPEEMKRREEKWQRDRKHSDEPLRGRPSKVSVSSRASTGKD